MLLLVSNFWDDKILCQVKRADKVDGVRCILIATFKLGAMTGTLTLLRNWNPQK